MELNRQKVEKARHLNLPTNSSLRRLLMRMINNQPEDWPSILEIPGDAYFGYVEINNDTFQ